MILSDQAGQPNACFVAVATYVLAVAVDAVVDAVAAADIFGYGAAAAADDAAFEAQMLANQAANVEALAGNGNADIFAPAAIGPQP